MDSSARHELVRVVMRHALVVALAPLLSENAAAVSDGIDDLVLVNNMPAGCLAVKATLKELNQFVLRLRMVRPPA